MTSNFDFSKVSTSKTKITDPDWSNPVSFFYKLTHPDIRDLYPIQRDILQNWYEEMKKGSASDKIVSLNTGGGKTLVGLMMAESIRREKQGKVLYICPNNLLGKQTLDEAKKSGIKVSSYLNIDGESPAWSSKDLFLENNAICVTNYHAVFNSKSIFKEFEIKGIVFDDAHLSLDLIDDQFTIRSEDQALIKKITDIFKTSPLVKEKIQSIQDSDPLALVMIPPLEWHNQEIVLKEILAQEKSINESFQWVNLKEKIGKTFCFVSARRIEISLLYPDIGKHFAFKNDIQRVYLSATLPNLDDITRVFGITPTRIETNSPDYQPQRLFIFSTKTGIENPDDVIRGNLLSLSSKVFVLVPNKDLTKQYSLLGASVADNPSDAIKKIESFKTSKEGFLALANRYDGIDLPGGTCHCLVVEGLPYTGSLKTKFFSEYFHNHQNSFLRSVVASKLIQAFGRTIRANNDYSIIVLIGEKLNSWVINKDNRRFFKTDLSEDIEIGASISETITDIQ
jgi:Rad3-related DNA helicase